MLSLNLKMLQKIHTSQIIEYSVFNISKTIMFQFKFKSF